MPTQEIICGDCRDVIPNLDRKFDFVFADPPFNIGQKYSGHNDRLKKEDFHVFTLEWLYACMSTCKGVLALHGPDDLVADYLHIGIVQPLDVPNFKRIAWINWHYRFGQCGRGNWIDARAHCLIYSNVKKHTWNPDDVLVESDRVKYGDKRIHDTENGGKRLPGTVWGIPSDGPYWGRVQGNSAERVKGCPNQLPEVYIERLVKAYTKRGDWVLDPFGGSGTTSAVCSALGRNSVTIDISPANCEMICKRLEKGAVRVKRGS